MNRSVYYGLLPLLAVLLLATAGRAGAAEGAAPSEFAFPPEIAAQEEAAAHGTAAQLPGSNTPAPKPAPPAPGAKPGKPAPATPAARPVVPEVTVAASKRPVPVVDYSLQPETLAATLPGRTAAQQLLLKAANEGKTTSGEMVKLISTTGGDQLDHLIINIASQRIYECNASGQALHDEPVSTGLKGLDTPPGDYNVHNKAPKAYSQKYTAWMLQWMGLTNDGSYGMHGLEGSSYERRLGHQASHGCVRLSRKYAKELYTRVKVGMPVSIVNDKDLKLAVFQPLSEQAATAQVMDLLGPADPDALFY